MTTTSLSTAIMPHAGASATSEHFKGKMLLYIILYKSLNKSVQSGSGCAKKREPADVAKNHPCEQP